ncbi:outer membrane protein assembly factor BamB family protein [Streptosporangium soli]|nr:PQQ-like beta-propeller repeat protein [Streptosporangium sp. KLBMP 9127]
MLMAGACAQEDPPKKVETDHVVGKVARTAVSGHGPALGLLNADWQVTVEGERANFEVEGGSLVLFTTDGVQGFDATTGQSVWHYREPGRKVDWSRLAAGVVLLSTEGEEERLVALDSATGRLLWEKKVEPFTGFFVHGRVLVRESHSPATPVLAGIDMRTGEELWDGDPDVGKGCDSIALYPHATDASVIVLEERCGGGLFTSGFLGLDPASGDVLWSHDHGLIGYPDVISVARGAAVISASDSGRTTIFSRDKAQQTLECRRCEPVIAGDHIVWLTGSGSGTEKTRMAVVNAHTGAAKVVALPIPQSNLISDGRRLYGTGPTPAGGQGGEPTHWVTVVDPATGSARALPIHANPGFGPIRWVGAVDGRLIVAIRPSQKASEEASGHRLIAYSSTPGAEPLEFSGVDPRSWPDCAKLVAAVPGKRLRRPDGRRDWGEMVIGSTRVARSSCYASDIEGIGEVSVGVRWVTKRPEDADALLDGTPGQAPDAGLRAGSLVRVGGVIVRVDGPPEAVQAVVKQLRSTVPS